MTLNDNSVRAVFGHGEALQVRYRSIDSTNHLRLSLQDLLQATDHGALRVAGDAGDTVELTTPGWTQIAEQCRG